MKIAVVHPQMRSRGGAENVVLWLSRILAAEGHEISLLTLEFDHAVWAKEDLPFKVELILGNQKGRLLSKNSYYLYKNIPIRLSKLLEGFHIAICHNFPSHLWCVKSRELANTMLKIIWYCHEPYRPVWGAITDLHIQTSYAARHFKNIFNPLIGKVTPSQLARMDKAAVEKLDMVLTNSNFTRDNIYKIFGKDAITCYPGIPVYPVKKVLEEGDYFLIVGKLSRSKNVETAIKAFAMLPDTYQGIKLRVLGSGSMLPRLKRLSERLGIKNKVEFLKFVDNGLLNDLYQRSIGSIYIPLDEPFGLVVLEAGLYGKPVIVSNHGGPSEIIDNMKDGIEADPLSPKEICSAIEWILQNRQKAGEMGKLLRNKVLKEFTMDAFKKRFIKELNKVIPYE